MPPRRHGQLATDDEYNQAGWQGFLGGMNGAAKWGIYSGILAGAGYYFSPVYRNLTFQFKVYLQMSGMTIGGCIEAERRVREYERRAMRMRKIKKDAEVWRMYEQDYAEQAGSQKAPVNVVAKGPVKNDE